MKDFLNAIENLTPEEITDEFQSASDEINRLAKLQSEGDLEGAFPGFVEKARRRSHQAIGKRFTVATRKQYRQPKSTFTGVCVECEFSHLKANGLKVRAIWKVVLEGGVNKTRREFLLNKI